MAGLKDMAKTHEEVEKEATPLMVGNAEKYPYGLRICLTEEELEKLGVDHSDWEIGDTFHLHAFAKVVSVSENDTENGSNCNISLQITHLAGPEDEDEEDEEEESEDDGHSLKKHGYIQYDE